MTDNKCKSTHIKELVPLIETKREQQQFNKLNKHQSELKDEELFYRVQQR